MLGKFINNIINIIKEHKNKTPIHQLPSNMNHDKEPFLYSLYFIQKIITVRQLNRFILL